MKTCWRKSVVVLVVILAVVATGWAQAPASERSEAEGAESGSALSQLQPALITAGVRAWEHDQVEGIGDLLLPVYSLRSGLFFVNPRSSFRGEESEMNLGIGYRHLLAERKMILGINAYYDRRETEANNRFNQAGVGLEFLSEWVDARANYYLPDDDEEEIITTVQGDASDFTSRTTDWNAPYGEEHAAYQRGIRVDTQMRVTPYTQYIQYEQALEGFDCEVGVRLPIPVVQDWTDVKVFAGYYRYDSDLSPVVDGWKGRLEVRALPALLVDAEVYEDDDLNGSSYYVGSRLQVPFDLAAWASRKNPFAGTLAGFKPTRRGGPFDIRMTEMVMRDPRVQTRVSEIQKFTEYSATETIAEIRKKLLDTLSDTLIYVDKDNTSGIEDGTFEHPFNTIGEGLAAAGGDLDTVYVLDSAKPYKETVLIDMDGLSLIGSGTGIDANGGYRFGSGIFPVLKGPALSDLMSDDPKTPGISYATVNVMADDVLISGLRFTGDLPDSLDDIVEHVMDVTKDKDVDIGLILAHAEALLKMTAIIGWDANNLAVMGNEFEGKAIGVLNIAAPVLELLPSGLKEIPQPRDPHAEHTLIVAQNRFDQNGIGVLTVGLGYGIPDVKIDYDELPKIPANVTIADNAFHDNLLGIGVVQVGGGLNVALAGNTFDNALLPVGVAALIGNYDGTMNAYVAENTVMGSHTVGMALIQEYGALNALIEHNTFQDCQLTALAIEANGFWAAEHLFSDKVEEEEEPGNVSIALIDNKFNNIGQDITIPDWELPVGAKPTDVLPVPDVPAVMFALVGNEIDIEVSNCDFNNNRGGALLGLAYAERRADILVDGLRGANNGTIFGDSEWIGDIDPDWNMDDEFPTLGSPFDYSFVIGADPGIGKGLGTATVTDSQFTDSGKVGAFIGDLDPLIDDIVDWLD